MLRILKIIFIGLLVLILGAVAASYIVSPVVTKRLITMNQGPTMPVAAGEQTDLPIRAESAIAQDAIDAAIQYGEETGTHALIVYRDGAIELEHYYSGHDASTMTPTQSAHKSVLAMLVGIAIDQGYIASVDEPAATYLTEWANDERSKITIRQMLQQTSGIDFDTFGFNPTGGFFQLMMGDEVEAYAVAKGTMSAPDVEFDYNSLNPELMGIIIERATGMAYSDFMSEALWKHIGAPAAAVKIDSLEHKTPRTFCCLDATARSWLHLGVLHLNDGRWGDTQVVPAEWMQAIRTPGPLQPNYGYYTWLGNEWSEYRYYNQKTSTRVYHSEPYAAPDVAYFDGMGGQRVYVVPSKNLVIVRTGAIAMDWDDAKLPNTILRGLN